MSTRVILYSLFLLLINFECILAQRSDSASKSRWYVFSPPDKSFRIEVPDVMRHIKDPEVDWLDSYVAHHLSSEDNEYRYVVGVVHFSRKERPKSLNGLEFMIGGDNRDPTSQSIINVDGLPGKEVIYSPPPEYGRTYLRGRIINAGTRIFIIRFTTDKPEDLSSSSTNRFFSSFHVSRKRLKVTRTSNKSFQVSRDCVSLIKSLFCQVVATRAAT